MCPPAFISPAAELNEYSAPPVCISPAAELSEYYSEEDIFRLVMQLRSGRSLPSNVLSDVDPYQFKPSNLPAEMWYFWSGRRTNAENGFWKSTGEACEIYSNPAIRGLRTTLRFYEGRNPHGQRTNWMMQEYTTTDRFSSMPDPGALYRVFLVADGDSGRNSRSELLEKNMNAVAGPSAMANKSLDQPSAVASRSPHSPIVDYDSRGDYLELEDLFIPLSRTTNESPDQPSALANQSPDSPIADYTSRGDYLELDDFDIPQSRTTNESPDRPSAMANRSPEMPIGDYGLGGDFLELDDLDIPLSRSTSSADSSCMTMSMTSEQMFDSAALLCELGDDPVGRGVQDSNVKLNLSAPAKSKEVIIQPATLESLDNGNESRPSTEQHSEGDPSPQNEQGDHGIASTSNGVNATSSSSTSEGSSKEEKRDCANQNKKRQMMKFFCFLAF